MLEPLKSSNPLARKTAFSRVWWQAQKSRLQRDLTLIAKQVHLFTLLIRHPEVPRPAKIAGGCAIAYIFSPIQLIPSFIPIIGQLDDLLVLFIGTKVIRKFTPMSVLKECEARAELASSAHIAKWKHIMRAAQHSVTSAA
jgi:uncharacterized membrane protein YkvA (DUF1232 family)